MAWDSSRQVPWKKLAVYAAIYAVTLSIIIALGNGHKKLNSAIVSSVFGFLIAATFMVVMIKFGWKPAWLRSRQEIAEIRQARIDARQARTSAKRSGRGASTSTSTSTSAESLAGGPRPKPAPTSRTSTGPSQYPRRTTKTRRH
jgi:hypothetical protein